jgi:hypothetical protein
MINQSKSFLSSIFSIVDHVDIVYFVCMHLVCMHWFVYELVCVRIGLRTNWFVYELVLCIVCHSRDISMQ